MVEIVKKLIREAKDLRIKRLESSVRRAKDLASRAKQYYLLASSVYNILDEVKDIVGDGIKKLEKEEKVQQEERVKYRGAWPSSSIKRRTL